MTIDAHGFVTAGRQYDYDHWYLILEADRLSLVYSDDGQGGITVTEDLETIPFKPYDILNFWHYLDEDGILRL